FRASQRLVIQGTSSKPPALGLMSACSSAKCSGDSSAAVLPAGPGPAAGDAQASQPPAAMNKTAAAAFSLVVIVFNAPDQCRKLLGNVDGTHTLDARAGYVRLTDGGFAGRKNSLPVTSVCGAVKQPVGLTGNYYRIK